MRTLKGLFLRDPLKHQGGKQGKDYSVPPDLVKMQEFFEKRKFPKVFRENFDENEIKSASADLQDHFHDNNSRH